MINIDNLLNNFIFYSIVVAGFNGIALVQKLYIFSEGYFWVTTLGLLIFILTIKKRKIYITDVSKLYTFFILWCIGSTLMNINNIIGVRFKGFLGERVMLEDLFVLIWLLCFIIYYTNTLYKKDNVIFWIYKAIKISFYISLVFAIIQGIAMSGSDIAMDIYISTQKIFNVQYANRVDLGMPDYLPGIIGTTKEPSAFGNYIAAIFPWLVLGAVYLKRSIISKLLCILAIICVVFSYSRTAYGTILVELIVMMLFIFNKKLINIKTIIFSIFFIGVAIYFISNNDEILEKFLGVIFSFSDEAELGRMTSNITRFSLQVAAFNMFLDNPLLGVGIGQFGMHSVDFLPLWAYLSPEMSIVTNTAAGSIKYGCYNTHLRILAENGIIGFILWAVLILKGIKNYLCVLSNVNNKDKNIVKLILLSYIMSITGFINYDVYIFFYYWLFLILSSVLVKKIKIKNKI